MNLIDSHCHLYYEPYINNLQKTLNDCKSNNINLLLSIAVDYETSLKNIEISNSFNEIYCTIGLHPNHASKKKEELQKIFNLYNKNYKIIGIGETGIDLYRSKDSLIDQQECFIKHIEFSIKNDLPFIVHSREAENEILNILESFKSKNLKFIMHCFSGSENFAKKSIDLGGYLSFSGNLTFKNNSIIEVCKKIPLDKILVETDSPYLTPHPYRGEKNHPKNVIFVAKKISEIKNVDLNEVIQNTTLNFLKIFNLN